MRSLSWDTHVSLALARSAPVAIGVSGGKDSQAAALATTRHLDAIGHAGPRLLVHSDLGVVEWNDSLRICQQLADFLKVELLVLRRRAGDLMDRWEARWRSSVERYESLSTVTLVLPWSTPSMRFCTSELKTQVIEPALKRRWREYPVIVNVTGVRRDESPARAKVASATFDQRTGFLHWRPIADWDVSDVFSEIDASGLAPHPAYRQFGMSRVSCRFCIMSKIDDMKAAVSQTESHDLYRRMVDLECRSTFAFQGSRWLGDLRPDLLSSPAALSTAKSRSALRRDWESRITPGMLYVKGWPTRMLTDAEAELLASIRRSISGQLGFKSTCLHRDDIHQRYAELIARREVRAA